MCNLGIGDALHPAEHSVKEHNDHAREQTRLVIRLEEAREGHANSFHLTDHVSHGADDQADHCHHPCGVGVIPITDELGHGELAVLPQIRRDQHRQNHITAGPTHQEDRPTIAVVRQPDQSRHGNERSGRHPVSGSRHAVGHGMNTFPRHIEFLGRASARADGDPDVQGEGRANDPVCGFRQTHASGSSRPSRRSRRAITRA